MDQTADVEGRIDRCAIQQHELEIRRAAAHPQDIGGIHLVIALNVTRDFGETELCNTRRALHRFLCCRTQLRIRGSDRIRAARTPAARCDQRN